MVNLELPVRFGAVRRNPGGAGFMVLFSIFEFPFSNSQFPISGSHSNLRTSRTALSPPKAKEFEIATRTGFSRAWLGT